MPRLYAEDTCLVVTAPSIDQVKSRLNSEMNKTCNWMLANKLTLNATKSKLLIINLKYNSILTNVIIDCKAGSIKSVNQTKYLGVILDHNLSFREHIKVVETKIACAVGIMCKLKYYLPQNAMLNALVHTHLNYEILIWGNTYLSYL